jgi:hypothetical protein
MPASVKIKYRSEEDGEGPFLRLMNPGEEGGRGKRVPIPTNDPDSLLKFATTLLNFAGIEVESNLERDREEETDDRVRAQAREHAAREDLKRREHEARERERKRVDEDEEGNDIFAEPKSEPGRSPKELGTKPGVPLQTSGGSPQTKQASSPVPPPPKPNVPKK